MVKGKPNEELLKRYRETMDGCDKKCKDCILYDNECLHDFMKRYEVWKEKQHRELEKFMKEYEG